LALEVPPFSGRASLPKNLHALIWELAGANQTWGEEQRWATFVRNHAKAIVAWDFFVSVTATFQVLYVFVAMEVGSRRILHANVTAHPTAEWTIQHFCEFLAFDHPYAS
jgi:hypothetical protein